MSSKPVEVVEEVEAPRSVTPLWGEQPKPQVRLAKETIRHRMIADLKGQGLNNKQIAEAVGVTPNTVAYTVKQPEAIDYMLQRQQNHAAEAMQVLEAATKEAAETLVESMRLSIKQDDKAKQAERILNRVLGTPTQTIKHQEENLDRLTTAELMAIAAGKRN